MCYQLSTSKLIFTLWWRALPGSAYYLSSSSCFEQVGKIRVRFGGRGSEGGRVVVGLYWCSYLAQMHVLFTCIQYYNGICICLHVFKMTQIQGKMHVGGRDLQLISWNVKGLGSLVKRGNVFKHLKSLSADIIFLQETHIKTAMQHRLKCNWVSQIYQSPFTSHACGVAILFRKNIPFQVTSVNNDPLGRYLLVSGTINLFSLTLLNIYGPNTDETNFFRKVFDLLPDDSDSKILIAGDFNCCLDPFLDRSSTRPAPEIASVKLLNNLLKTRNLVDIWRIQHPSSKEYSFYSNVHKSYSRIDYFLTSSNLISQITDSKYHNILISDHSPLAISLNISLPKQTYTWRFNPNLLMNDNFVKNTTSKFKDFIELNDNGEVSDVTLWETLKVVLLL